MPTPGRVRCPLAPPCIEVTPSPWTEPVTTVAYCECVGASAEVAELGSFPGGEEGLLRELNFVFGDYGHLG